MPAWAQAPEIDKEQVELWRHSYERAKTIVDAPTPAESFRCSVRFSIENAVDDGLAGERAVEELVTQICYRAADLAHLLDLRQQTLSTYSRELRTNPRVNHGGADDAGD